MSVRLSEVYCNASFTRCSCPTHLTGCWQEAAIWKSNYQPLKTKSGEADTRTPRRSSGGEAAFLKVIQTRRGSNALARNVPRVFLVLHGETDGETYQSNYRSYQINYHIRFQWCCVHFWFLLCAHIWLLMKCKMTSSFLNSYNVTLEMQLRLDQ